MGPLPHPTRQPRRSRLLHLLPPSLLLNLPLPGLPEPLPGPRLQPQLQDGQLRLRALLRPA